MTTATIPPPPGLPQVTDYGNIKTEHLVKCTVLETGTTINGFNLKLIEIPAGWACAGSMARWDQACLAVQFLVDGAMHGRRFKAYPEAKGMFDRLNHDPEMS